MRRLCACGCKQPLDGYRSDAKWATDACAKRWERANPGRSRREARATVVGRTKPGRRSGVSIRIGARAAIQASAAVLVEHAGVTSEVAYVCAREALLPLVNPRHRELL